MKKTIIIIAIVVVVFIIIAVIYTKTAKTKTQSGDTSNSYRGYILRKADGTNVALNSSAMLNLDVIATGQPNIAAGNVHQAIQQLTAAASLNNATWMPALPGDNQSSGGGGFKWTDLFKVVPLLVG